MNAPTLVELQPFQSHAALRAEHLELLKDFTNDGESVSYAPRIKEFIQRGVAAGVYLDRDADRRSAQSVLDYWGTRLYRLTEEEVGSRLLDFDPSLAPKLEDALCPYVGLEAFAEAKRDVFFGRQRLAMELAGRLKNSRVLIVVGSSGSGKSSLVRAGLLPAMKKDAFPPEKWQYLDPIVPGADPQATIAELLQGSQGGDLVLVIDQFEEVFTLATEEESRQVEGMLLELIRDPAHEHRIILTLRADFVTQMTRLSELNQQDYYFHVPPLTAGELREAIQAPADLIGLKFDDGIVDALLNEILGEPAALPLLQFTLLRLWENRERNRITWAAYQRLGGGRKALGNSATEFYENGLLPEEQSTARQILLRMVRPGEGLEVTSNRVLRKELFSKSYAADRVETVLDKFQKAHLLRITPGKTRDEDRIEVAHEALIRNWPKLEEWLETERDRLRERRRLTTTAELWQERGRDPSILLRGSQLEEAAKYDDLNDIETAFMKKSLAVKKAEDDAREAARLREEEERKRTEKIAGSGVLAAGLLLPLVGSVVWVAITTSTVSFLLMTALFLAWIVVNIRIMYFSLAKLFSGNVTIRTEQPVAATGLSEVTKGSVDRPSQPVVKAGPSEVPARPTIQPDQPLAAAGPSEVTGGGALVSAAFYLFFPINAIALLIRGRKLSRFVRFHAIQSTVMAVVLLAISFVMLMMSWYTPFVIYLFVGYLWVFFLAIQAGRGKYNKIPLLGDRVLKSLDGKK